MTDCERSIIKTFRKELWTRFVRAIQTYELIDDGDSIAVCVSGGKDSTLMAKLFQELYAHGRRNFKLRFLTMDPGYNDRNLSIIKDNASSLGIPLEVFRTDIYDAVASMKGSPCYMCARMRRGALYSEARKADCNKIALAHHYDDVIETILMGMLYGGQIQTMMPKLHSDNFEGMELIRPMYLIREADIIRWKRYNNLNFIHCACRFTEEDEEAAGQDSRGADIAEDGPDDPRLRDSSRLKIKKLIKVLKKENRYIEGNIFKSVENVHLDTVIGYKKDGSYHSFLENYNREEE